MCVHVFSQNHKDAVVDALDSDGDADSSGSIWRPKLLSIIQYL